MVDAPDENFYNGYYCIKCKYIPLIQIIPKNKNIFILSLCHCNRSHQKFEIFHKNFYQNKIPLNNICKSSLININKEIKDDDISLIYKKFNEIKDKITQFGKEIFDNLNNYIKEKDPDNLNNIYENYVDINKKIISIIENYFTSYKQIKDNPSIKLNIINICFNKDFHKKDYRYLLNSSPDIYYKNSVKFFQEEYLISEKSLGEQLNHKFFKSQNNSVLCFLEISNNICASNVKNNPNIFLYKIENNKNKLSMHFKAHTENVSWLFQSQDNHLISCGNDGYIKIWPIFDENYLANVENNSNLEIKPLYEFNTEIKDIQKMIYINNNSFLAASSKKIFLFNYLIDNKEGKIDLIKTSQDIELTDLILIKRENKDPLIAAYNKNELNLINTNNLEINKTIQLNNIEEKNCLIQLNVNEMMIAQNNNDLLVLNIDNLSIKLKYNIGVSTDYLYKLNDGTLIQSGSNGMRRMMIKNLEELPILYTPFNDTEFDHPYRVYEKITCLNELSDRHIIKCVVIGTIYFCEFSFI